VKEFTKVMGALVEEGNFHTLVGVFCLYVTKTKDVAKVSFSLRWYDN
jgi:hypothetical protein